MFLSIRDDHTRFVQPDGKPESHAKTLETLGLDHVEIWLDPHGTRSFTPRFWQHGDGSPWTAIETSADAHYFRKSLEAHGIFVSALCLPTDFAAHPEHIEWATDAVFLADLLGASSVRIDTATKARDLSPEQMRDTFCAAIEQVLADTSALQMPLGIENHGFVSNDPAFLDGIFARVGDARLGLTLDPGNFYWFGLPLDEVYAVCEHFAPRARHTHFKSIAYPAELRAQRREPGHRYAELSSPLQSGDLDIARLVKILRGAGYKGDLCIENEALGHFEASERLQVLASDAACLHAALEA
jgi:sugar phosphate isomerase/epimerase